MPAGCYRFNRNYSRRQLAGAEPHNLGGLLHFPLVKTLEQLTICQPLPLMMRRPQHGRSIRPGWRYNRYGVYHCFHRRWRRVVSGGKLLTGPGGLAGHIGQRLPIRMVQSAAVDAQVAWKHCFWSRHCSGSAGGVGWCECKTIFTRAGQGDEQAQQLIHRPHVRLQG